MSQFDPHSYGPAFEPLLAADRRRPLDAGHVDSGALPALNELAADSAFAHVKLADHEMAACCIAGVWLLHDFLDESHKISQGIDTASGSFWHAIMHRRESDFSNAKYWFRRVGRHPVFDKLGTQSSQLAAAHSDSALIDRLIPGNQWDSFAFVDKCRAAQRGSRDSAELCLDIQQAEWELLFDYCYHEAVGR